MILFFYLLITSCNLEFVKKKICFTETELLNQIHDVSQKKKKKKKNQIHDKPLREPLKKFSHMDLQEKWLDIKKGSTILLLSGYL